MKDQSAFSERVQDWSTGWRPSASMPWGRCLISPLHRLVRFARRLGPQSARCRRRGADGFVARPPAVRSYCRQPTCPWAYLLRMVRNESLLIARRKKRWIKAGDLSDLVARCCVDEIEREETYRAIWSALRHAAAAAGRGCGVKDLGGNDIRSNCRGSGGVAEHGRQPISICDDKT